MVSFGLIMAGIDKAAIAVTLAVVAIALGAVAAMDTTQSTGTSVSAPTVSQTAEPVMEEKMNKIFLNISMINYLIIL